MARRCSIMFIIDRDKLLEEPFQKGARMETRTQGESDHYAAARPIPGRNLSIEHSKKKPPSDGNLKRRNLWFSGTTSSLAVRSYTGVSRSPRRLRGGTGERRRSKRAALLSS
ncbi:hypothetical protein MTO96_009956 [Rhipicephalus appendiculatus]